MAEAEATTKLSLVIKPTAGGPHVNVQVEPGASVLELKAEIAKHNSMAATEQRLIYKGQILKDERTVESYGIASEHVLHLVRGRQQNASSPSPAGAAAAGGAAAAPTGLFGSGAGGAAGAGSMEQMMSEMMNSPLMQPMLNNPELVRAMLQSNPAVRELMDRHPELAHALNDPAILRQSLQIAANPNLLQEHMRTADRTLSNIEGMPEGFNALRRMYESMQAPSGGNSDVMSSLMEALNPGAQPAAAANAGSGNSTSTSGAAPAPAAEPNSAPLPNPWAPQPAAQGGAGGDVPAGLGGLGLGGFGAGGFPGMGGLPGMGAPSPEMANQALQMLQNPAMQQMMQQMMAQPGFMEGMINSNPQMRAMMDSNPQMREMLRNPEFLRAMTNPQMLQSVMQMQAAMQGNPLFGALGGGAPGQAGAGGAGTGGGLPMAGMPDLSTLMASMGGMGFPMAPAPAPVADPETAYATQLGQLADMGFFDRAANIRALQATNGNVHAAVERLLGGA